MAFMIKEIFDLKGILFLMLLTIPSKATTNIDCHGKPFHCVNSTHFMICVDLGSGISTTIDDFVIPCPSITACRPTNRFECEFPAPSASELEVSTVASTLPIENDVTTFIPPVTSDVHFEEYLNTISYPTLSETELQLTTTGSISSVEPTAAEKDITNASNYDVSITSEIISKDAGAKFDSVVINSNVSRVLTSINNNLTSNPYQAIPVSNQQEVLATTDEIGTRKTDSLLSNTNYSDYENVTSVNISTSVAEDIVTTAKIFTTVLREPLHNKVMSENPPITSTAVKPAMDIKEIENESNSNINATENGIASNLSVNTPFNFNNDTKADYLNILQVTEASIENNKSVVLKETIYMSFTESPVILVHSERDNSQNLTSVNDTTTESINADKLTNIYQHKLTNANYSNSLATGTLTSESQIIEETKLLTDKLTNFTISSRISVETVDDQVKTFTADSIKVDGFNSDKKENDLNAIPLNNLSISIKNNSINVTDANYFNILLTTEIGMEGNKSVVPNETISRNVTESPVIKIYSETYNSKNITSVKVATTENIDADELTSTYQQSLTNVTYSDSLVTGNPTTEGQVIEVATLQPETLSNFTIASTIAVKTFDDQVNTITADSITVNGLDIGRKESELNAFLYSNSSRNTTTNNQNDTEAEYFNILPTIDANIESNKSVVPNETISTSLTESPSIILHSESDNSKNLESLNDTTTESIIADKLTNTYQHRLLNANNSDSLATANLTTEDQVFETTTLQPDTLPNFTVGSTITVEKVNDQGRRLPANIIKFDAFDSGIKEIDLNAIAFSNSSVNTTTNKQNDTEADFFSILHVTNVSIVSSKPVMPYESISKSITESPVTVIHSETYDSENITFENVATTEIGNVNELNSIYYNQQSITNASYYDSKVTGDVKTLQQETLEKFESPTIIAVERANDQENNLMANSVNDDRFGSGKKEIDLNAFSFDVTKYNELKNESSVYVDTTLAPKIAKKYIKPFRNSTTDENDLNTTTNRNTVVTVTYSQTNLETLSGTSTTQNIDIPDILHYNLQEDTENIIFDLSIVNTTNNFKSNEKGLSTNIPDKNVTMVAVTKGFIANTTLSEKKDLGNSESVTLSTSPTLSNTYVHITDSTTTDTIKEKNGNDDNSTNIENIKYFINIYNATNKPTTGISTGTTITLDPDQILPTTAKNSLSSPKATVESNTILTTKYSDILLSTSNVRTTASMSPIELKVTQTSHIPIYQAEITESLTGHFYDATHGDKNKQLGLSILVQSDSTKLNSVLDTNEYNSLKENESKIPLGSTKDYFLSDFIELQNQNTLTLPLTDATTTEENTFSEDGFNKQNEKTNLLSSTPEYIISTTDFNILNIPALVKPTDQTSVTENLFNALNYRIGENTDEGSGKQEFSVNMGLVQIPPYSSNQFSDAHAGATQRSHAISMPYSTPVDNNYNGIMPLQLNSSSHSHIIKEVNTTSFSDFLLNTRFVESSITDLNLNTGEYILSNNTLNDKSEVSNLTIETSTPYLNLSEPVTSTSLNNIEIRTIEPYGEQLLEHKDGQIVTEFVERQQPEISAGTAKTFEKPISGTQNNMTSKTAKALQSSFGSENHITGKTTLKNFDILPVLSSSATPTVTTQTFIRTIPTVLDVLNQTRLTTLPENVSKQNVMNTSRNMPIIIVDREPPLNKNFTSDSLISSKQDSLTSHNFSSLSRVNTAIDSTVTKREFVKKSVDIVDPASVLEPVPEKSQKRISNKEEFQIQAANSNAGLRSYNLKGTASLALSDNTDINTSDHILKYNNDNTELTSSMAVVTASLPDVAKATDILTRSDVVVDKNIEAEKSHFGITSSKRKANNENEKVFKESKVEKIESFINKLSEPEGNPENLENYLFSYPNNVSITAKERSSFTNNSTREPIIVQTENNNFHAYGNNNNEESTIKITAMNNSNSNTNATVSEINKEKRRIELLNYDTDLTNSTHTPNTNSNDQNKNTFHVQNKTVIFKDQSSTPHYVSQTKPTAMGNALTEFPAFESTSSKPGTNNFTCKQKIRGRYADEIDCRKFYICIGNNHVVEGTCPINTVFSEMSKQCTKNLSQCIRNNQFRCVTEGRFSDFLNDNVYYICVKNNLSSFIRFKLQCQNGYHLNKTSVRCVLNKECKESTSKSEGSKNNSDQSVSLAISEQKKKTDKLFKCNKEGIFADPTDCKRYFECTRTEKRIYKQKRKKCDSDEVFHKDKKKCVDDESYECN